MRHIETRGKTVPQNMIFADGVSWPAKPGETLRTSNALIIGNNPAGSIVIPNILQMNASYVIYDASGELYRDTAYALSMRGYNVKAVNTKDMGRSRTYNPFAYKITDEDAEELTQCILDNTAASYDEKYGHRKDPDAVRIEERLLLAIMLYERDFRGEPSLPDLDNCLYNILSPDDVHETLQRVRDIQSDGVCAKLLEEICAYPDKQTDTALKSLRHRMLDIIPYGEDRSFLTSDTVCLDTLRCRRTALFYIGNDSYYGCTWSLLVTQILQMSRRASGGLPVRIFFDSFKGAAAIPDFFRKLEIMPQNNVSFWISVPDYSSVIEDAVKNNDEVEDLDWLPALFDYVVYLGSRDSETQRVISTCLRKALSNKKDMPAWELKFGPLRLSMESPEQQKLKELTGLSRDIGNISYKKCLVFAKGEDPVYAEKYDVRRHPMYRYTAEFDPALAKDPPARNNTIILPTPKDARDVHRIITPGLCASMKVAMDLSKPHTEYVQETQDQTVKDSAGAQDASSPMPDEIDIPLAFELPDENAITESPVPGTGKQRKARKSQNGTKQAKR